MFGSVRPLDRGFADSLKFYLFAFQLKIIFISLKSGDFHFMKTVTLKVPEPIAELYPKVGDKLFLVALREAVKRLITEEQRNLKTIQKRIVVFERKYKTDFADFQKNLPPEGDYRLHEDYGEWSYLMDVAIAIKKDIANYQRLNGTV